VGLDPDLFKFHPPEGSSEIAIINWLDPGAPPTDSAYRISDQMVMPELVSIVPPTPKFPPPTLPPNSAVVLAVEVNPNGMVQNIKVNYSLGKDIDNNAIEAVKKWYFEPATQDGKPITVVAAIAILFSGSSP
jgi:TonB family protein